MSWGEKSELIEDVNYTEHLRKKITSLKTNTESIKSKIVFSSGPIY